MKNRLPTTKEINELISFLPRLYAEGHKPVKHWSGCTQEDDGAINLPWPEYDDLVKDFIRVAERRCWSDFDYVPGEAKRMLENEEFVKSASLAQIKTMLTYCVRGERFCDGHWAAMIEGSHIRRLLERLAELASTNH